MSLTPEQRPLPALSPWRTVLTVLAVCLMMLAGFVFLVRHGATAEGATAFGSLCMAMTLASTGQALKGTLEQIANGSGLRGIRAALLTDAKPGEPAP